MSYKNIIISQNNRIQNLIDYFNTVSTDPIHASSVIDLFKCALSYYYNRYNLSFTYSGSGTLYDTNFDKNNPLIDCSSMVQAWISGVSYENSKYYSNNTVNTPTGSYGIILPNNPYNSSRPNRYYANELAHYFFDKGCCFIPTSDCLEIMPGDIIFMSYANKAGNEFHENAFMKIDHCSLVVGWKDSTHLTCLHTTQDQTISFYDIDVKPSVSDPNSTTQYNDSIVLVARIPFKQSEEIDSNPIAYITVPYTTTPDNKGLLATLDVSLQPCHIYTMVASVENAYEHGDNPVSSNYVGLRAEESSGIFEPYTAVSWQYNKTPEDNIYYLHFITNDGVTPDVLKLYVLTATVAGHKFNGMYLYEGFVRPHVEF